MLCLEDKDAIMMMISRVTLEVGCTQKVETSQLHAYTKARPHITTLIYRPTHTLLFSMYRKLSVGAYDAG